MARAPGDEIVAWDFETPADDLRDSSASAIAVAGLLKLAPYVSSREAGQLREVARRTVETLVSRYLTPVVPADARGRAC
jgi:unsaturated chondroitin disaccharide hydrolase